MSNLKLNQVIALQKGAKSNGESALTQAYHLVQKTPLLAGITKTYQPRDDEGETLPSEGTRLQLQVEKILDDTFPPLIRLLDLTTTLDSGNQSAKADVIVDDVVILPQVPVTTLLSLEKKLVDLATFVAKLPVLDPSENWTWDEVSESYRSDTTKRTRTKKIPRNHVKAEATDKHPAQVEVYYEDTVVGDWSTTLFSGAISATRRRRLTERVAKLQAAVKVAREQANMTEVPDVKIGEAVFEYLDW